MLSNDFLHTLSEKAARLFPHAEDAKNDLEKRLYNLMQTSFGKLNLVTREEFDSQLQILRRAEATIAELEKKVAELEAAKTQAE